MPRLIIPAHELRVYVDPRDGTMWKCEPIDQLEIDAALASGVEEERRWNDIVNTLSNQEAQKFHINRIATLARQTSLEAIVVIVENHTNPFCVYLYDGHHHLAAAYARRDLLISAVVGASKPASIGDLFPGTVPASHESLRGA